MVAAVIVVVIAFGMSGDAEGDVSYRTGTVERGTIISSISTSGTIAAVVTVEVGSQISGQILELSADYNTPVAEGQVIARIDPQTFESRVIQAEAELTVARANVTMQLASRARVDADVANSQANLVSARSRRVDADRELVRKDELVERGVASKRDGERARTEAETALAQVHALEAAVKASEAQQGVAAAQIETARAQVQMRQASLQQAMIDLDRTFIRAPVTGVVIDRKVSVGQTVAASLSSPVLFTIAQDLRQMQVETALDEADIGQITEGLSVAFSVDAFPGRNFQGRVMQIRRAPIIQQNVVTYTVIVSANNADLRLLPGMTANVEIEVERREGILTIPNAALRFRPDGAGAPASQPSAGGARGGGGGRGGQGGPGGGQNLAAIQEQLDLSDDQVASLQDVGAETRANLQALRAGGAAREEFQDAIRGAREKFGQRLQEILTPEQREKFQALNPARQAQGNVRTGQTWVEDGGEPKSRAIRYGLTDGSRTELIDGELSEGDKIIIGQVRGKGGSRGFVLRF